MSARILVSVLVTVVALQGIPAGLAAQSTSQEIRARALFERAQQAVEERDYQSALDNFERVMELIGRFPELLYNAAQAAWEIGDIDKAEEYVYQALDAGDEEFRASPQHELAYRLAARVEEVRGRERIANARVELPRTLSRFLRPEDGAIRFSDGDSVTDVSFACRGGTCTYQYLRHDAEPDDFGETVALRVTVEFRAADITQVAAADGVNGIAVQLTSGSTTVTTHELRNGYPFQRPRTGTGSQVHFYVPNPDGGGYVEIRSRIIRLLQDLARVHRS